jgi:hypothetical protein
MLPRVKRFATPVILFVPAAACALTATAAAPRHHLNVQEWGRAYA